MATAKQTIDISKLDLEELQQLVEDAQKRITELQEDSRRQAFSQMEAAAAAVGLSPIELLKHFGAARPAKKKASALYRNPDNADETWSGRGRKPAWIEAWLAAGNSLDELKIES